MSTTKLLLVLCCVLILAPAAVGATDPWLTDVMPRLADFVEWHLQVGGDAPPAPEGFADKLPGVADSVYDVQWPVTVKKTEGDWLWIVDEGGYSVPPAHGWVRKDAMLKLTDKDGIVDSYAYYMTELRKYNDPHHAPSWVHWLLGITLEKSKKDTKNAQMEYWRALGLSAGPETLDNAEEALDRAYQALGEARRRLESDTNMAAAPNPVPLLQTVRERLIEGRGFLRTAIALRQAHQPPAWTIIPLRRAPAVPPAGIVIAPAMSWNTARVIWDDLSQWCDRAWDDLQQEQIIVDAGVANAVGNNHSLLDAAVRLERLRASDPDNTTASIALEAAEQLDRIRTGSPTSTCAVLKDSVIRRPQISYEEGEALRSVLKKKSDSRHTVEDGQRDLLKRQRGLDADPALIGACRKLAQNWNKAETAWKDHEKQWADDESSWACELDDWAQDTTRLRQWAERGRLPAHYIPVPSDFIRANDDPTNIVSEEQSRTGCIPQGVIIPPEAVPFAAALRGNFLSDPRYRTDRERWRYDQWIQGPLVVDPHEEQRRDELLLRSAEGCYGGAQELDHNWWWARNGRGQLYLDMASRLADEAGRPHAIGHLPANPPPDTHVTYYSRTQAMPSHPRPQGAAALTPPPSPGVFPDRTVLYAGMAADRFTEAIGLNADQIDSYRDRANAYWYECGLTINDFKDRYDRVLGGINQAKKVAVQVGKDEGLIGNAADRAAEDQVRRAFANGRVVGGVWVANTANALFARREVATEMGSRERLLASGGSSAAQSELTELLKEASGNPFLKKARDSAYTACDKGNFAIPDSLTILAKIYSAMCDYERAVHYQRLAVIYASNDADRSEFVKNLRSYRDNVISSDVPAYGTAARQIEADVRRVP